MSTRRREGHTYKKDEAEVLIHAVPSSDWNVFFFLPFSSAISFQEIEQIKEEFIFFFSSEIRLHSSSLLNPFTVCFVTTTNAQQQIVCVKMIMFVCDEISNRSDEK